MLFLSWKTNKYEKNTQEKLKQLQQIKGIIKNNASVDLQKIIVDKNSLLDQINTLLDLCNMKDLVYSLQPHESLKGTHERTLSLQVKLKDIVINDFLSFLYEIRKVKGVFITALSLVNEKESIMVTMVLQAIIE
ncbi:hypothetical protein ACFL1T_00665 [Chlamydiota bacterium]